MATPRTPRQPRAKATVDAIIEAGFISLGKHGLTGTTTSHIAEIAGISVGSLYEYFANKEAVHDAMRERFISEMIARLKPEAARIARMDVTEAIRTILEVIHDFLMEQEQRNLRYARAALLGQAELDMAPLIRFLQELTLQYLLHHPQYAVTPRLATMTFIFIHGGMYAVLRHLSDPAPEISFEELVEGLGLMVFHYLDGEQRRRSEAQGTTG